MTAPPLVPFPSPSSANRSNFDNGTCGNNGGATWTYNQGVLLNGLTLLAAATGNASYTAVAESVLKGVEVGLRCGPVSFASFVEMLLCFCGCVSGHGIVTCVMRCVCVFRRCMSAWCDARRVVGLWRCYV